MVKLALFITLNCVLGSLAEVTAEQPVLTHEQDAHKDYCPAPEQGTLKWSVEPGILDFACDKEYKELHCCVHGYDQLLWYKWTANTTWEPLNEHHYERHSHNQTVYMKRAEYPEDLGDYKCVATQFNTGKVIRNKIYLEIFANCSNWHEEPRVSSPQNNATELAVTLGSNVTITCEAFFGNCYQDICSIDWLRLGGIHGFEILNFSKNESRIYVVRENLSEGKALEAQTGQYCFFIVGCEPEPKRHSGNSGVYFRRNTLHIQGAEEEDLVNYECSVGNSYGEVKRYIHLSRYSPPSTPSEKSITKYIVGGAVGALAIVLGLASVPMYYKKTLRGKLWWKKHFGKLPKESKQYDVTLIYHTSEAERSDDEVFAEETLRRELCDTYHYRVFDLSHILPGQREYSAVGDAIRDSHAVVFVISPDFIRDAQCTAVYESVQHETCTHIYVKYTEISEKEMQSYFMEQRARNPDNTPEVLFRSIETGLTITWPIGEDEKQIKGKQADFWMKLQLFLPNIRPIASQQTEEISISGVENSRARVSSNRSDCPLIQRENSNASHISQPPEASDYGGFSDSGFAEHA